MLPTFSLFNFCCQVKDAWRKFEDQTVEVESLNEVPICISSSIKEIHFVKMKAPLLSVVKYFLENCGILERFSINFPKKSEKYEYIKIELLNFPKASPLCEIDFED